MNERRSIRNSALAVALATAFGSLALGSDDYWAPPSGTGVASGPRDVVSEPTKSMGDPHGPHDESAERPGPMAPLPPDAVVHGEPFCGGCNTHPEPSFGGSFHAMMQAQVSKGEAALMVLHHYDFVGGGAELNYRGRQRLQRISQLVPRNLHPIIIQASRENPQLDSARYAHVVSQLGLLPFPIPAERVVVGLPPARPMDGVDAEIVHQNLLNLMLTGGGQAGSTGSVGTMVPTP